MVIIKEPCEFNLLIVDDEDELRDTFALYMGMSGYKIYQASGGIEAIEIVKANQIDLIISDIRMPKGDGIFLLDSIQKMDSNIPIVLLTGFSEYSRDEVIERGALDLLSKPYGLDMLEDYIDNYRKSVE